MDEKKVDAEMDVAKKVGRPKAKLTVEILFNVPWEISMPGRGKLIVAKGKSHEFDLRDRYELNSIISIMKEINRPATNSATKVEKIPGSARVNYQTYNKAEIIEGKENLPQCIRTITYRPQSWHTAEEKDEILKLCPDYFERGKLDPVLKT